MTGDAERSPSALVIRPVQPREYEALGRITVEAFRIVNGGEPLGDYERHLADVAGRAADCEVMVAVDVDGRLLGGVAYVTDPTSSMSVFTDPHSAGMRMLAVAPDAQGRGVGHALARWCIDEATRTGHRALELHTTTAMSVAMGMYERFGFERDPEHDVWFTDKTGNAPDLLAYVLRLDPVNRV